MTSVDNGGERIQVTRNMCSLAPKNNPCPTYSGPSDHLVRWQSPTEPLQSPLGVIDRLVAAMLARSLATLVIWGDSTAEQEFLHGVDCAVRRGQWFSAATKLRGDSQANVQGSYATKVEALFASGKPEFIKKTQAFLRASAMHGYSVQRREQKRWWKSTKSPRGPRRGVHRGALCSC